MDVKTPLVVVLGTGGTIAGTGPSPGDLAYQAAQLSVSQLLQAVPGLSDQSIESLQVAQIDSKDMDWTTWQALGRALAAALAREDVGGVVITHGSDTLEETAYLLHRLLDVDKPVVLTAAMRAATSAQADGPRNLRDAVLVAGQAAIKGHAGVVAVMAGVIWPGHAVRKSHTWHIDAFDGGDEPPLGRVSDDGAVVLGQAWPLPGRGGWGLLNGVCAPRVEIVTSHEGADGWLVDALLAHGSAVNPLRGLVVAGTGHGTIHEGLSKSLSSAQAQGVKVWRSSRVARGGVPSRQSEPWPGAGNLTAAQARVALMLEILGAVPASHPAG